jgi:hypothetical protein
MSSVFLGNLGIPDIQQARPPTTKTFPPALNGNNKSVWEEAVRDLTPSKHPQEDWGIVLRRYVDLCGQRGVYPFQSVAQSRNDDISDFLRDSRRELVKFIDRTDFFEGIKLRSTQREVTMTNHGFVLTVSGHANITDPSFESWLTTVPFPKFDFVKHGGRYWKNIRDGLRMFAYREGGSNSPDRWIIGYEMSCRIYPDLPTHHLPSRDQLEKFVMDVLFMPQLRAIRPKKVLNRLF